MITYLSYVLCFIRCRDPLEESTVRDKINKVFGRKPGSGRRPVGPDMFSMENPALVLKEEMAIIR